MPHKILKFNFEKYLGLKKVSCTKIIKGKVGSRDENS